MYNRKETIGDCVLLLGDCLEIMPILGKVDTIVTDPPYGIGINKSNRLSVSRGHGEESWDESREIFLGYYPWMCRQLSGVEIILIHLRRGANSYGTSRMTVGILRILKKRGHF